ncbi:MAG: hypothetical protein Q8O67_33440 [Deltaproteobacteria bacterium]|nr:hypothetical protein [Deltaproteobacteria bacterium]
MLIFAFALLMADVAAVPAPAPAPKAGAAKVLIADPKGSAGLDVKGLVGREVAGALSHYPAVEALAYGDLRRMIELQTEKQLTSCDEVQMTACLADLQSALGVPWAVFVDVDEVGGLISVGVTLVGEDNAALARETLTVTDAAELQAELRVPMRRLVTPLHKAIGAEMPIAVAEPILGPVLMGSGAVVVVVGVVVGVVGAAPWFAHEGARAEIAQLRTNASVNPGDAPALLKEAEQLQVDQRAALLAWDQYGQALVVVGAIGVTLGVGAFVGGLFVE